MIGVLAVIWFPEFSHFYINRDLVALDIVSQAMRSPTLPTLDEIADISFAVQIISPSLNPIDAAEEIVQGTLQSVAFLDKPMHLKGFPKDLTVGPPTFQLGMASLAVEDILLKAFELSQDDRFLRLALSRTMALAQYEKKQFQDVGFLWNDHAISARVAVLTRLWRNIRNRPDIPINDYQEVLSFVSRCGRLLEKPNLFTVRTNHGVMQNIALLQIAAAFPSFPESAGWRRLAIERLNIQLQFYISKEGVILEHSAEYHLLGTTLLSMAIRLIVLNGIAPDAALIQAQEKAISVLDKLIRPDGTLPAFGNTSVGTIHFLPNSIDNGHIPLRYVPPPYRIAGLGSTFLPLSGYAVWWSSNGAPEQAVIAWAKHDGHGHKHADEGSFVLWSGGTEWITNAGYWPYGHRLTDASYSWNASNAPHEMGESNNSKRVSKILTVGESETCRFVEIHRENVNGAILRRQILQVEKHLFAVLDFSRNQLKGTETVWTIGPYTVLEPSASGIDFLVNHTSPDHGNMAISYSAVPEANIKTYRGSEAPFAGWVAVAGRPTPSDAIRIVHTASESVTASVFRIGAPTVDTQSVVIEPSATPDRWQITVLAGVDSLTISREVTSIKIRRGIGDAKKSVESLVLLNEKSLDDDSQLLKDAYASAISIYPPWYDFSKYRVKLSVGVIVLGALVEIVLFVIRRRYGALTRNQSIVLHSMLASSWLLFCIWAMSFYLQK